MMTAEPQPKKVHINFDNILDIMHRGVRRASSFMALGMRVVSDNTISSVRLDQNFAHQFMPDPLSPEASAEVRENFEIWLVGNGLRELDQYFAIFADRLYQALVFLDLHEKKVTTEALKRVREFEEITNSARKLQILAGEFGAPAQYHTHLSSLSHVRNALTHNLGVVALRHCQPQPNLRVSWLALSLVVGDQIINDKFEPVSVEKEQPLEIKFVVKERTFEIGQSVSFSPHELSEICYNCLIQAQEVVKFATEKCRERGLLPKEALEKTK